MIINIMREVNHAIMTASWCIWLLAGLADCLAVWLSGCLAVWLSGCLAVCRSGGLAVWLSGWPGWLGWLVWARLDGLARFSLVTICVSLIPNIINFGANPIRGVIGAGGV